MTRTTRRTGFSLIELMVAMSIFSVIGVAIVSLLARTTEFSRLGTSTTETLDALQTFTQEFSADASAIYSRSDSDDGAPAVRLWSDVVKCAVEPEGKPIATARRLMFVRMVPHEATDPLTRAAGTAVGAREIIDQAKDSEEAEKGALRATGGLMEVLWTAVPESAADPAVLTLYRGVRSPIGGAGSFFPSKTAGDPSAVGPADRGPRDTPEVRAVARPVLAGVLYFGVEFWARRTTTWDASVLPPKGPLTTWDSTRGVMRKGKGQEEFWFAKEQGSLDRPTLTDPTDDTFPRRIRVTLVVEEAGQAARTGKLMSELSPEAAVIEVSDTKFIPATDTTTRYVKIGSEWIEFTSTEGARLTGCRRGVRGTVAQSHRAGEIVHHGRTVVREVPVAAYRDAYRDELPTIGGR